MESDNDSLVADIESLAYVLMHDVVQDTTMEAEMRAIAQYMLLSAGMKLEYALRILRVSGCKRIINKLLDCESGFMSCTPSSIGIHLASFIGAEKVQKSLDVKHVSNDKESGSNVIVDRLHSSKNVRIRFYTESSIEPTAGEQLQLSLTVRLSGAFVYDYTFQYKEHKIDEANFKQNRRRATSIDLVIRRIEREYDGIIIYCTELPHFLYNPLLFLSNYLKFHWCTVRKHYLFDPTSAEDIRIMVYYLTYGMLFTRTKNLTNMPTDTHNPFIAYTGERPKNAMSKFNNDIIYNVEGTRAMLTTDMGSDFGARSNFIEITSKIEIDSHRVLDNII